MSNTYADLYDIVEQRLQEQGIPMVSTREAFCCSVLMEPGICDGKLMETMENPAFLETAYLGLLNRLPDESANKEWKHYMKGEQDKFRQELMNDVVPSMEAILKGSSFQNNQIIETKQRALFKIDMSFAATMNGNSTGSSRQRLIDQLYKVYLKLPGGIRLFLRKVLRRG